MIRATFDAGQMGLGTRASRPEFFTNVPGVGIGDERGDRPAAAAVASPRMRKNPRRAGIANAEVPMHVVIEPLVEKHWPALEAFFREGGDPRWCWCQYWRLRAKDFSALKVPQLRERLHEQARSAEPPGLVAFDGDRAVGWVSLGPRTEFERIVRSKVIPTVDERPVWSIVCFAVSGSARGQGVGRALIEAAIEYARERGAEALEAYPIALDRTADVSAEAAFTGTLPMFERAGFEVVAERASDPSSRHRRVVVRRELLPEPPRPPRPPRSPRSR